MGGLIIPVAMIWLGPAQEKKVGIFSQGDYYIFVKMDGLNFQRVLVPSTVNCF